MFAMDRQWWDKYLDEVNATFVGARYSINPLPSRFHVTRLPLGTFDPFGNSGAACISLALQAGAKRVIMLGYDCQKTDGKTHWHGDHPQGLGNAGQIHKWHEKFATLAKNVGSTEVINASRATALTCFARQDLESALEKPTTT